MRKVLLLSSLGFRVLGGLKARLNFGTSKEAKGKARGGNLVIIAVDFDGVVVENDFPRVGCVKQDIVNALRECMEHTSHEFILWTSRVNFRLLDAVDKCKELSLTFDAINGGAPSNLMEFGTDPRKIYADVYIDDNALGYSDTVVVEFLNSLIGGKSIE